MWVSLDVCSVVARAAGSSSGDRRHDVTRPNRGQIETCSRHNQGSTVRPVIHQTRPQVKREMHSDRFSFSVPQLSRFDRRSLRSLLRDMPALTVRYAERAGMGLGVILAMWGVGLAVQLVGARVGAPTERERYFRREVRGGQQEERTTGPQERRPGPQEERTTGDDRTTGQQDDRRRGHRTPGRQDVGHCNSGTRSTAKMVGHTFCVGRNIRLTRRDYALRMKAYTLRTKGHPRPIPPFAPEPTVGRGPESELDLFLVCQD